MPFFDPFSGSVSSGFSSLGSAGEQAMGALGSIAGTAGRISGAINSATNAVDSISALRSINLPPGGNPIQNFAAGAALFNGAVTQAIGAVGAVAGAVNAIGSVANDVGNLLGLNNNTDVNALGALGGAASAIGGFASALGGGGSSGGGFGGGGGGGGEWRVRISGLGGQLVWPYTPTISVTGGANYEEVPITHQNYSFFAYQNSKAETINVSGSFYIEDASQGPTWLKAVAFLRANTKMFPDGNPPFICKFNAYGPHVFNNVPVLIRTYSVELPANVDYIACGADHVPIRSTITAGLQPIYSREQVKTFSLFGFLGGANNGWV